MSFSHLENLRFSRVLRTHDCLAWTIRHLFNSLLMPRTAPTRSHRMLLNGKCLTTFRKPVSFRLPQEGRQSRRTLSRLPGSKRLSRQKRGVSSTDGGLGLLEKHPLSALGFFHLGGAVTRKLELRVVPPFDVAKTCVSTCRLDRADCGDRWGRLRRCRGPGPCCRGWFGRGRLRLRLMPLQVFFFGNIRDSRFFQQGGFDEKHDQDFYGECHDACVLLA